MLWLTPAEKALAEDYRLRQWSQNVYKKNCQQSCKLYRQFEEAGTILIVLVFFRIGSSWLHWKCALNQAYFNASHPCRGGTTKSFFQNQISVPLHVLFEISFHMGSSCLHWKCASNQAFFNASQPCRGGTTKSFFQNQISVPLPF